MVSLPLLWFTFGALIGLPVGWAAAWAEDMSRAQVFTVTVKLVEVAA